jgi:hypothetical protein
LDRRATTAAPSRRRGAIPRRIRGALDAFAFNGNANLGIAPNKNFAMIGAADMIIHVWIVGISLREVADRR